MTREERQTAELRLAAIGGRLSTWCQNETYYSDQWVYSWHRIDDIDEDGDVWIFGVRVGHAPHEVLRVTEDELLADGFNLDGLNRALAPLEVPAARKAEQQ